MVEAEDQATEINFKRKGEVESLMLHDRNVSCRPRRWGDDDRPSGRSPSAQRIPAYEWTRGIAGLLRDGPRVAL
jgi:hypothetical protein